MAWLPSTYSHPLLFGRNSLEDVLKVQGRYLLLCLGCSHDPAFCDGCALGLEVWIGIQLPRNLSIAVSSCLPRDVHSSQHSPSVWRRRRLLPQLMRDQSIDEGNTASNFVPTISVPQPILKQPHKLRW